MSRPLLILSLLLLTGCSTASSVRWYAPATWFSHKPADAVDTAQKKKTEAEDKAIRAAQRSTHETAIALEKAPESRPVEVARRSNLAAKGLLDQVAGPMNLEEDASLRKLVADLLSENAEIRAKAEKERAKEEAKFADVSASLGAAQAAVAKAEGKLREAFERENALANELRSQRALFWIACGVGVLAAAGWLYVKFALGGLPSAAGMLMRDLRAKDPKIAAVAEGIFDRYLSRREQSLVAKYADK